ISLITVEETHERGIPLEKGAPLLPASVAAFLVDVLGPAVGGGVDWNDLDWNYNAPSGGPPCWSGIEHDVRWRFLSSRTPYIGSSGRLPQSRSWGRHRCMEPRSRLEGFFVSWRSFLFGLSLSRLSPGSVAQRRFCLLLHRVGHHCDTLLP